MKIRQRLHKARHWLWPALFVAYSATAIGVVVIDASDLRYQQLSQVKLTSVKQEPQARRNGASQVAAVYRAQSGMPFSTLPAGATFQIVWPDGSTETMMIVDPTSAAGTVPVPGTQQPAPDPAR